MRSSSGRLAGRCLNQADLFFSLFLLPDWIPYQRLDTLNS